MKNTTKSLLIAATALISVIGGAIAGAGHDHGEKKEAGPNGGRLLTAVDPHAEFLVTPDRKVRITFIGKDGKVVPVADQVVTVTTGERSAPVKLAFVKEGNALVSDSAIPEGNMLPTVIQIKSTPAAKAEIVKFNLNMANCSGCSKAEYACTCAH
jgi:hypothetical protein